MRWKKWDEEWDEEWDKIIEMKKWDKVLEEWKKRWMGKKKTKESE